MSYILLSSESPKRAGHQMRIIHGKGYSVADRREFCKLVYQNVFMGVQNLARGREAIGINYGSSENAALANEIWDDPRSFGTFTQSCWRLSHKICPPGRSLQMPSRHFVWDILIDSTLNWQYAHAGFYSDCK